MQNMATCAGFVDLAVTLLAHDCDISSSGELLPKLVHGMGIFHVCPLAWPFDTRCRTIVSLTSF
jgi:hypothetical protein